MAAEHSHHIPVLDLAEFGPSVADTVQPRVLNDLGAKVKEAFQSVGFCYIKNHGIDGEIINKHFSMSRAFSSLPTETKQMHARLYGRKNLGWVAMERERLNPDRPGDLKEAFNFYPPDDPPNWPLKEEDFQKTSQLLFEKCSELSRRVCRVLSVGLGLDENFLTNTHKLLGQRGNQTALRSLYYPPIAEDSNIKPSQIRLGEHSDYLNYRFGVTY